MTTPLRFSVLDRSLVLRGRSPAESLRRTVRFAVEAERLGYHRFWVAEHHGVPGVAGSAPAVLAAAVAGATSRIRVGTGGVMLPNHPPLVVAEQFGVLESLHPGRIDLGVGRSVGFTAAVRAALGHGRDSADRFAEQLAELLGHFAGGPEAAVRAMPAAGTHVPVFVLATGAGAEHAAAAGLPLVIAAVRGDEALRRAVDGYREHFRPSPWAERPHVVLSRSVAVAETSERARRLLVPEAWATASSCVHGVFPPLEPADEVLARSMDRREAEQFERAIRGHVHGTAAEVADRLQALLDDVAADELLITTSGHDEEELLDSYRRLAELMP
ncbi:MsnO8 family LLM class oxidoreductase [Saccharopolyspora sp. NPDC047091]|uniref:MsnO8 family LLM class oxidoreductase n=1 Tax=Saccharopolyspora sp. NPDC047091 TaxID=3155924 RepID=UPI003401C33B